MDGENQRGRGDYAERVEARRERLEAAASAASAESAGHHAKASAIASRIPFGQPILVGHHSERRARRDAERIVNGHIKAAKLAAKASSLASAASSVGTGGVSSDDPEAVAKLRVELEQLTARRDRMKAANAAWRKCKTPEQREALIAAEGLKESTRAAMLSLGQHEALFPTYTLTNLGANIRRITARIAELSKAAPTMEPIVGSWFRIEARPELNRISLKADRRVSGETFKYLRSAGWRWSPSEGAFLWNLNERGIWRASQAAEVLAREVVS